MRPLPYLVSSVIVYGFVSGSIHRFGSVVGSIHLGVSVLPSPVLAVDVLGSRAAFAAVFAQLPDARWNEPRHFVQGDRGVSEWTLTATRLDGQRLEVNGCDLFTFRDGKIAVKNSYRKNRPPF